MTIGSLHPRRTQHARSWRPSRRPRRRAENALAGGVADLVFELLSKAGGLGVEDLEVVGPAGAGWVEISAGGAGDLPSSSRLWMLDGGDLLVLCFLAGPVEGPKTSVKVVATGDREVPVESHISFFVSDPAQVGQFVDGSPTADVLDAIEERARRELEGDRGKVQEAISLLLSVVCVWDLTLGVERFADPVAVGGWCRVSALDADGVPVYPRVFLAARRDGLVLAARYCDLGGYPSVLVSLADTNAECPMDSIVSGYFGNQRVVQEMVSGEPDAGMRAALWGFGQVLAGEGWSSEELA